MKATRVFISHSSRDRAFADLVAERLGGAGTIPWIDRKQVLTGHGIFQRVGQGLQTMDLFVFLVSRTALKSGWVSRELNYATIREIAEKRVLVLPFVIDNTPTRALPWFLQERHVSRIRPDAAGSLAVVAAVREAQAIRLSNLGRPKPMRGQRFRRDPHVDEIVAGVKLADWAAADAAALEVLRATADDGANELFQKLVGYLEHRQAEDVLWGVVMTVERCVQLAPKLATHEMVARLARHPNFTVRSSAASMCMDLVEFAPDRVPVDVLLRLAVHTEDWYVEAPATAALKRMARLQPAALQVFYGRLRDSDGGARAHAARAFRDVARQEPEILDAARLRAAMKSLKAGRDVEAINNIRAALASIRRSKKKMVHKYLL